MEKEMELEGWWLNLPEAEKRATCISSNLQALGLTSHYYRFEGTYGDPQAAQTRELSIGEAGAWCSWIRMIQKAAKSKAEFTHLMEDDTEITEGLQALLHWDGLHSFIGQGGIVCTDGYVSPAQARHLLSQPSWGHTWQGIVRGLAVPCINSMIATPATWALLLKLLQAHWNKGEILEPIDVQIGKQDEIRIMTVAPFVTIPRLEQARTSQIRKPGDSCMERSREALTLLRRLLRWPTPNSEQLWNGEWDLFWESQSKELQQRAVLDALDGLVQRKELKPY